jgi:hypothetical protein
MKEDLLGFEIYTRSAYNHGGSGLEVYLRNKKHGFLLQVVGDDLKKFGFYAAGPELGVLEDPNYSGTYEDRLEATVGILSECYDKRVKGVGYWGIKGFISSRELPTKKLKDAFKFSFEYLHNEYQDLWKFCEKQAIENPLKN